MTRTLQPQIQDFSSGKSTYFASTGFQSFRLVRSLELVLVNNDEVSEIEIETFLT